MDIIAHIHDNTMSVNTAS